MTEDFGGWNKKKCVVPGMMTQVYLHGDSVFFSNDHVSSDRMIFPDLLLIFLLIWAQPQIVPVYICAG